MDLQTILVIIAVFFSFIVVRFGLPAALTALFCYCDRRFIHPQQL